MKHPQDWIFCAVWIGLLALSPSRPAMAAESRLVLTNGSVIRIQGKVEHKDGLVLFRTLDGTFGSVKESAVAQVVTGAEAAARPASANAAGSGAPQGGVVLYTNEDLVPLQPPTVLPPEPTTALPVPPAENPAGAPESGATPVEAAPAASVALALELRQQLQAAEVERNTAYRLLVCAQHEIPFDSPDCKASLLPKPDNSLSAGTEAALRTRYLETEKRIEDLQKQLKALKPNAPTEP